MRLSGILLCILKTAPACTAGTRGTGAGAAASVKYKIQGNINHTRHNIKQQQQQHPPGLSARALLMQARSISSVSLGMPPGRGHEARSPDLSSASPLTYAGWDWASGCASSSVTQLAWRSSSSSSAASAAAEITQLQDGFLQGDCWRGGGSWASPRPNIAARSMYNAL